MDFQEQNQFWTKDTNTDNHKEIETAQEQTHKRSTNRFLFETKSIKIEEQADGKVFCGTCKASCIRILAHLNNNQSCKNKLYIDVFKVQWTKYKTNQRKQN